MFQCVLGSLLHLVPLPNHCEASHFFAIVWASELCFIHMTHLSWLTPGRLFFSREILCSLFCADPDSWSTWSYWILLHPNSLFFFICRVSPNEVRWLLLMRSKIKLENAWKLEKVCISCPGTGCHVFIVEAFPRVYELWFICSSSYMIVLEDITLLAVIFSKAQCWSFQISLSFRGSNQQASLVASAFTAEQAPVSSSSISGYCHRCFPGGMGQDFAPLPPVWDMGTCMVKPLQSPGVTKVLKPLHHWLFRCVVRLLLCS